MTTLGNYCSHLHMVCAWTQVVYNECNLNMQKYIIIHTHKQKTKTNKKWNKISHHQKCSFAICYLKIGNEPWTSCLKKIFTSSCNTSVLSCIWLLNRALNYVNQISFLYFRIIHESYLRCCTQGSVFKSSHLTIIWTKSVVST